MSDSDSDNGLTPGATPEKSRFWDQSAVTRPVPGKTYSLIVRWMRLILPLIALCVIGLLIAWPRVEDAIKPAMREAAAVPAVAKNEVLNPRFESVDSSDRPFVITAARAMQSLSDADLVLLEQPAAEMTLSDGHKVGGSAQKGAYKQKDEDLWLEGGVRLSQDEGYELEIEKLLINMKTQKASSDQPVKGHGPAGSVEATGLQLDNQNGTLILTGPAKLVLKGLKGL